MPSSTNTKPTKEPQIEIPQYLRFSKVIVWVMYFWVMIGVASLAMRVFLLLFSANMEAGFANLVARISNDYMQPFDGIFVGRDIGETGYFDVSAMFAIIVYLFAAWGIQALISYVQNKIDITTAEQEKMIAKHEAEAKKATAKKVPSYKD